MLKNFKVTVEYNGNGFVRIDNNVGLVSNISTRCTMHDIVHEFEDVLSKSMFHITGSDSGIAKDLALVGYSNFIAGDMWAIINGKVWTIYDILLSIKNNDYEELRAAFEDVSIMKDNKYLSLLMDMCSLYKQNRVAFFIMTRYILKDINMGYFDLAFDKTYNAAAISDNIKMFETLQSFNVPYRDVDRYLITATENNSECVVNFILTGYEASQESKDLALHEAIKNNNDNLIKNLRSHGATFNKCE